ncbi:branchpoint-bridging protein-like [Schistocerca piceifrons]|uniref:branchpoint-bridging protein-like n=1 Tax=Schistocerca piceifrons TaxID=274613 RepID=UPI001F5FE4F4|nr:branchpoint-bridging protein-like [Schistocerca piceifrons]
MASPQEQASLSDLAELEAPRRPRALLPSSPLPVWSAAPDGRLSPPPRHHLSPPPSSSAVAEPMGAEADVTPPPPPSVEVVGPPPYPSIPSGGARPGQAYHKAFSSPPREQFGVAGGQRAPAVPLPAPSAAPPLAPSTRRRKPDSTTGPRHSRRTYDVFGGSDLASANRAAPRRAGPHVLGPHVL